jgi:hypothetical protein
MIKPVGYKSPPNYTKWAKGQSGNPSGRKSGQRNLKTDLVEELTETIQVTEGGKLRKLTKQRALLKGILARAIKGDTRAASVVFGLITRLLGPQTDQSSDTLAAEDQALLDSFLARARQIDTEGQQR